MNQAIEQGIKDYNDCPQAYGSMESAIKYRVAQYIWDEVKKISIDDEMEVLNLFKKINA